MKARLENNKIVVYGYLPSEYSSETLNIMGGFEKLSNTIHKQEGFFDYVVPTITEYQKLGEVFFDNVSKVFTFPIIDFTQLEIDEQKTSNLTSLRESTSQQISGIKGFREAIERYILDGTPIPKEISVKRDEIKLDYNTKIEKWQ